jgi:hypothetical protein
MYPLRRWYFAWSPDAAIPSGTDGTQDAHRLGESATAFSSRFDGGYARCEREHAAAASVALTYC